MPYYERETIREVKDQNGNVVGTESIKNSLSINKNDEPPYIKIYTQMWCQFNRVPERWHSLFFSLVCRMTYADMTSETGGQVVHTSGTTANSIVKELGWKSKDTLYRGLQALCDCKAIRKLGKGEYQVNPQYAGRGPWRYNAQAKQGGVKDLIAKFSFRDKQVETFIEWDDKRKTESRYQVTEPVGPGEADSEDDGFWD